MASRASIVATRTTTQLLNALHEPGNEPAWSQLDQRYRNVIKSLARRLGLGEAEAQDVAQQTLAEFVTAYRAGRYERGKGRLSSWILGIARNLILAALRERSAHARTPVDERETPADDASLRRLWGEERDRELLMRAMDALREDTAVDDRTLRAFDLTAMRGVPAAEAGAQCGMSTDQVYVARSRVTRRLREIVERMTAAFEEDV